MATVEGRPRTGMTHKVGMRGMHFNTKLGIEKNDITPSSPQKR